MTRSVGAISVPSIVLAFGGDHTSRDETDAAGRRHWGPVIQEQARCLWIATRASAECRNQVETCEIFDFNPQPSGERWTDDRTDAYSRCN